MSQTKRMKKNRESPGPADYDANYSHEIEIRGPRPFGSTAARAISLGRDINCPFVDSTNASGPPVGAYLNSDLKYTKPKKDGYWNAKRGFNSTSKPKLESTKKEKSPGPGTYDLNFRDELKILDHKLSGRYQISPFGSCSP